MKNKILPNHGGFWKTFLFVCFTLIHVYVYAQDISVSGVVKDDVGEPLPGVSVLLKGSSVGTITDVNGAYTLKVPATDATLVFSFVGFVTEEVSVDNRSSIDINLNPDITSLEEVVVIGYGEQKKSLTTGAISSVKAKELSTVSTSRIDQALQGRTSGVHIVPTSGSPGSGMKIRIRGISSNGSSSPLFIVDGVRTGADGMDFLNPNEVESVEVLKDAASAAIYGAEGANGVVIVTTKKGKKGIGEITYSGQYGVQSVDPDLMTMMNSPQYQTYMEEAEVSGAPTTADLDGVGNGTDWFGAIFEDAPQQSHSLSFSGGSETSTYFVAGTVFNQEGIVGGDKSKFDRYTIRLNSSHEIKDWLKVGENLAYINIHKTGVSENTEFGSIVGSALALDPLTPVKYDGAPYPDHVQEAIDNEQPLVMDENGNYYGISNFVKGEFGNPVARINLTKGKTTQNKILGNVFAELTPIDGFKFTTRLGIDAAFQRYHNWTPTYWYSSESLNTVATGSDTWDEWYTWQFENFASYSRSFNDHNFTLLLGTAIQRYTYNNVNGSYSGLFREEEKWSYGAYTPDDVDRISSNPEYRSLASFFGRISYDYQDKYMVDATFRRDGSSMLADGNEWGTFPSASVGWVISNEDFFPSGMSEVMSYVKLRASWGQNGSLSNLYPGQWQNSVSTNVGGVIRYPTPTGTYIVGASPTNLVNPELKWETTEQIDVGADFRFFDGQVSFTVDYYKKKTFDLITPGAAPYVAGNELKFVNAGDVVNKGFEFELTYRNAPTHAFQYEISANLTTLDNEVTYLDPNYPELTGAAIGTDWGGATRTIQGKPVWSFYGYVTDGIIQNQAEADAYIANGLTGYEPGPGDPRIKDLNGDNQISPADQSYIGNPHPDLYYGARINLRYKGFDFLVFLQGQYGNDILMGFNRTDRPTANKPAFFYEDRWTGEGSTNSWFGANTSTTEVYSSDFMVFDGSYARIRQLQLGYTLPSTVLEQIRLNNFRVYVTLDNFFTFTDYPGIDPEAGSGSDNSIGIDRGVYPIPRTVMGGVTFSF